MVLFYDRIKDWSHFPILACLDDETSAFEDPPKDTTD